MAVISSILSGLFGLFCALAAWLVGGQGLTCMVVYLTAALGLFALLTRASFEAGLRSDRDIADDIEADLMALNPRGQLVLGGNHRA